MTAVGEVNGRFVWNGERWMTGPVAFCPPVSPLPNTPPPWYSPPVLVSDGIIGHPGYIPGNWYTGAAGSLMSSYNIVVGEIYLRPVFIYSALTIAALGVRVQTTFAGGNFQLALYSSSGPRPSSLIVATPSVSSAVSGPVSVSLATPVMVEAGWHWTAIAVDNPTATFVAESMNTMMTMPPFYGSEILGNVINTSGSVSGLHTPGVFGTWPSDINQSIFSDTIDTDSIIVGWQVSP